MDSLEAQQTVIPEVPKTKRTSKKKKPVKEEEVFIKQDEHHDEIVIDTDTIKVADIETQSKTKKRTPKKKSESSGESDEDVFKVCVSEILKDAQNVVTQLKNLMKNKQVRQKRI